ncbi:MAG: terminase gpP N-terminus-related DNA-binding protein, partial [Novosphingobium sp.]
MTQHEDHHGAGGDGASRDGAGGGACIHPAQATRLKARALYWRHWTMQQIADELAVPYSTVASWKTRHKWDDAPAIARAAEGTLERYLALIAKEKKTGSDYKEIDLLGRQMERLARIERYREGGNEADLNPKRRHGAQAANAKKQEAKNRITPEMAARLRADMEGQLHGRQKGWLLTSTAFRTRMILK